jgi:hypothetical protein
MFDEPEVQRTTAKFAVYLHRKRSKHQGAIELRGRPKASSAVPKGMTYISQISLAGAKTNVFAR